MFYRIANLLCKNASWEQWAQCTSRKSAQYGSNEWQNKVGNFPRKYFLSPINPPPLQATFCTPQSAISWKVWHEQAICTEAKETHNRTEPLRNCHEYFPKQWSILPFMTWLLCSLTPSFTLGWTLTPMSTADASRERVLIAQVQILPALWPSQRTASSFALRYLCRGADPERSPSHRRPHTAHPSAAGVSGMRSTQIHWCRLSRFHCRLPGERREKKNQSQIPDAERSPLLWQNEMILQYFSWRVQENLTRSHGYNTARAWMLFPPRPGNLFRRNPWDPTAKNTMYNREGGSNPLQKLPKQAPSCW